MKATKQRKLNPIALATICGITALSGAALAQDVLFDNLDYDGDFLYHIFAYSIQANDSFGQPDFGNGQSFVVNGGDYTLDTLIAPILYDDFVAGVNELTLSVYTNGGDGLPDTLLETATFSGLTSTYGTLETFDFSGTTVLQDGARYWITATVPDDAADAYSFGWFWNADDSIVAPTVTSENNGPWQGGVNDDIYLPQGAFRVEGTLVPAPGVLTGFAALGLLGTRRRRGG